MSDNWIYDSGVWGRSLGLEFIGWELGAASVEMRYEAMELDEIPQGVSVAREEERTEDSPWYTSISGVGRWKGPSKIGKDQPGN